MQNIRPISESIIREWRYESSAWCRSGTIIKFFMSASTGREVAGNARVFGSDTPLTYRLMYANASLTLLVPQRYLPSSTRSPPVASPKSYHSFSRSLTLNDGVTSFLRGERYQYCSDFIYCARWPSWAKKSTIRTRFASSMVILNFFSLVCTKAV